MKKSMPETFSSFALNEVAEKSSIKEKEHHAERKISNSGYTSFDEEEMKGHEGGHHRTSFDTFGGPTPEGSEFSSEAGSDETLPFELIALEIALEMVCNALEVESDKVEREGKPQLEKLRQEVNQTNLEKVRRVKNRLVRINARVSKVAKHLDRLIPHLLACTHCFCQAALVKNFFQTGPHLPRGQRLPLASLYLCHLQTITHTF